MVTAETGSLINTFRTPSPHGVEPGDYVYIEGERRKVVSVPDSVTCTVDVDFVGFGNDKPWYHWTFEKRDVEIHIGRIRPTTVSFNIIDGGVSGGASGKFVDFSGFRWETLKRDYYALIERSFFRPFVVEAWTNIPVIKLLEISGKIRSVLH